MADNVSITPGTGNTVAADEVIDGTLGTVKVQYVKIMDGTLDGTAKATVNANGLKVDGSAVTQPISGTITANAGTGSLTVNQATGTNLHVVVDTAPTTAITAASLPLPSGAATEATLSALNTKIPASPSAEHTTAASPSAVRLTDGAAFYKSTTPADTQPISGTVTSNIGTTNGLALDSSVTGLSIAQASTTAGEKGVLNLAAVTTASPVYTTAQSSPLSLTTAGALRTDSSAVTQPVSGTITATQATGTNLHVVVDTAPTTAVTESGTWTVQPGNTPNTTPWLIEPRSATIASYSASIISLALVAAATDIFTITGSATKLVKIKRVIISATQTTAGAVSFVLLKRSTADTAGTSTAPVQVPHDSNNAAGTVTIAAYTANPTVGTLVGNLVVKKVLTETATSASDFQGWDFSVLDGIQPIVLRGVAQQFAINLNGATVAGGNAAIAITWTEE